MSNVIPETVSSEHHAVLCELAARYNVATEFGDWQGHNRQVADHTLMSVLAALDVDATTLAAAQESLASIADRDWLRQLPPVVVTEQGQYKTFNVHVTAGASAEVWLKLEDGRTWGLSQVTNDVPDREVQGQWIGEATFAVPPDLPLGYHRLVLRSQDAEVESQLIVTPGFLGMPQRLGDKRIWGYATQFYSVRSQQSWGMGDLADLADLATWTGTQHNAGYVLINPVHAPAPISPIEPSPYLPSSRRYVSPLYIRVEDIPEYHALTDADQAKVAHYKSMLEGVDPGLINRDASWTAKIQALAVVFAHGLRPVRQMAFDDFKRKEGRALTQWATWCSLVTVYGQNWQIWPTQFQRPSSPEVLEFAREHAESVAFFEWLQWIVDTQLAEVQKRAREVGMPIGIVNDLAVGVSRDSAEAWAMTDVFAMTMSVGAPPDQFNQRGQDWGQPPWRPDRLADLAYAPFRSMVAG
ncbi:MAG: 4-alpha-glucanotransferase, partial [Propionibacteriaceae bacterium]